MPLHGTGAPALPDHVVDAVAAVLARRMTTPPVNGLGSLRRALAAELERTTTRRVDPESQILVTNGAMQALGVCFRSLLEPGDEVVVPAPTFFFGGPIRTAGGVPVYVRSTEADGWRWDAEAIEQAVGARTKALLLCNPGNPTGYAPSREDVAAVVSVAERHGLVIVTDEAYEASLWDGAPFTSAFGLGDDVIVIRSLGKSLVDAAAAARLPRRAGRAGRCLHRARSSGTASASTSPPRRRRGRHSKAHAAGSSRSMPRPPPTGPSRSPPSRATPGLTAATPFAAPFLFVGSRASGSQSSARGSPTQLEAVGLPVVDGAAFEGPGYARLPFGGAAEARVPLTQRARPLGQAARSMRILGVPRRTAALIGANALGAAVQGQFQFVLPWMLLSRGHSPQTAAIAAGLVYAPLLLTAIPAGAAADNTDPRRLMRIATIVMLGFCALYPLAALAGHDWFVLILIAAVVGRVDPELRRGRPVPRASGTRRRPTAPCCAPTPCARPSTRRRCSAARSSASCSIASAAPPRCSSGSAPC